MSQGQGISRDLKGSQEISRDFKKSHGILNIPSKCELPRLLRFAKCQELQIQRIYQDQFLGLFIYRQLSVLQSGQSHENFSYHPDAPSWDLGSARVDFQPGKYFKPSRWHPAPFGLDALWSQLFNTFKCSTLYTPKLDFGELVWRHHTAVEYL